MTATQTIVFEIETTGGNAAVRSIFDAIFASLNDQDFSMVTTGVK